MTDPAGFDLYIPLAQVHPDGITLLRNNQFWMMRTDADPSALRTTFVSALQAVDRDAAVSSVGTMRQGLDAWMAPRRFSMELLLGFSLTALLLAVSGLYGLVAYAVSQRRREIGLRMALGASTVDVRRLILTNATTLAVAGIALGSIVAFVARPLTFWLVGDTAIDLGLAGFTAIGLFAVVTLAAAVPAIRASRIAPTIVLKGD